MAQNVGINVSVSVADDDDVLENLAQNGALNGLLSKHLVKPGDEKQFLSVNYTKGMRRGSIVIPADKNDFARANRKPKPTTDGSSGLLSLLEFPPESEKPRVSSAARRGSITGRDDALLSGSSLTVGEHALLLSRSGRRRRRSISNRSIDTFGKEQSAKDHGKQNARRDSETRKRRAKVLINKLRVYSKLIIFLYRLCKHYQSLEGNGSLLWGEQVDLDDVSKDLLFDVTYFRVGNRQSLVSSECQRILSMPPALRTDKDKYHVLIALRNYPSFTEYPLAMQQEIVGVGWYAVFGSKRVILRQGHWPLNFYFILSGSVVINVLDEATGVSRTVVYLTRGESFGELGLLSRQRRQSTVIAREKLELLCISDKLTQPGFRNGFPAFIENVYLAFIVYSFSRDYTRIFMAGGLQTLMNPNQSDFVRSLSFLEGWPMHLLQQSHKKCIFSYFKKGDVLIRDSNASDWIVIIKSGSCFVMKVLHRVKEEEDDQSDIIQVASKRKKRRNSQKRNSVTLIENFEQRKKREEFEKFMNELSLQDKEANIDKLHDIVEENDDDGENNGSYLRQEDSGKAGANERRRTSNSSDEKTDLVRKRKSSESSSLPTPEFFTFKDENEDEDEEDGEVSVNPIAGNAFWELERASAAKGNSNAPTGKKKTIMDDIVIDAYQEEDLKEPIWVSIRTLTRGSVFGLAELVFDSQPSFTVVSNGAECILLSKKFYLEHANAQVMNRLRRDAQRFPGQDDLQVGLETKLEWDDFKVFHMNQLLGEKAKAKQAEALSRY